MEQFFAVKVNGKGYVGASNIEKFVDKLQDSRSYNKVSRARAVAAKLKKNGYEPSIEVYNSEFVGEVSLEAQKRQRKNNSNYVTKEDLMSFGQSLVDNILTQLSSARKEEYDAPE